MRAWIIAGSCLVLAACTLGDDAAPLEVAPGSWDGSIPETCIDGTRNGSESDVDCGGEACSRCGLAAKCAGDGDCASGYCAGGACAAASCGDAVKDGAETDVDCGGGACPPCKDGKACVTAAHCESKSCIEGVCAAPSCSDGVQNGAESFVDCGAGCPCDAGLPCVADADCKSDICSGGLCSPSSCTDGVTNGTESDVDCGGACPLCGPLQSCATAADCASGVCTTGKCQAPTCSDGVKNGGETDADCGTACGKPCADGKSCALATDCTSDVCLAGVCVPATCVDGVLNGGETAVDCGGGCPCDAGEPCTSGGGCKSGVCAAMVCQAPACVDGVKNGAETDKDCGAACPACANGKACAADGDCQSQVCTAGTCKTPTCADATKNGAETDVDCGGAACSACGPGEGCAADGDCAGNTCIANVCAPSCSDGVKNQGESDVDCGGSMCAKCAVGDACALASDCASAVCGAGTCLAATCTDGLKSGGESDVDCGGPTCPLCGNAKTCVFAEDCASGGCNAGTCGPWVKAFGVGPTGVRLGVTTDLAGNLITAGPFQTTIDLGGGPISPAQGPMFVAKYTHAGVHVFSEGLATAGPSGLATDASGNVFVASYHSGPTNGCYAGLPTNGSNDSAVAKLSPAGTCLWAQHYGGIDSDPPLGIAVFPSGDVVLMGYFNSPSVAFGATTLTNAQQVPQPGMGPFFVARIAADGTPIWAKSSGSPSPLDPFNSRSSIAVDPQGDVFFAGGFVGTMDFGAPCPTLASTGPYGYHDGFIVKLSGLDGSCVWAKQYGVGWAGDWAWAAVDAVGDVLVAGSAEGSNDLGGGALGYGAGFVAKFSGAGSYMWAHPIPASVVGQPACDAAGNVIVPCSVAAPTDFGGGVQPFGGVADACVAKYSGVDGSYQSAKVYGSPGDDFALGVALNALTQGVVLGGYFEQPIDFGSGPVTPPGPPINLFLLSMGPMP